MLKRLLGCAPGLALWLAMTPGVLAHGAVHEQIAHLTRQIAKDRGKAELYLKRGELHRAVAPSRAMAATARRNSIAGRAGEGSAGSFRRRAQCD